MPRDVSGTATGTVDASGSVTLIIPGPHRTGTRWSITSATIESVRGATGFPSASLYRSIVAASTLIGTSRSADAVTFDGQGDWLLPGDSLLAVIADASPSTRATLNIYAIETP